MRYVLVAGCALACAIVVGSAGVMGGYAIGIVIGHHIANRVDASRSGGMK